MVKPVGNFNSFINSMRIAQSRGKIREEQIEPLCDVFAREGAEEAWSALGAAKKAVVDGPFRGEVATDRSGCVTLWR